MRLLVVDDDKRLASLVKRGLEAEAFAVDPCGMRSPFCAGRSAVARAYRGRTVRSWPGWRSSCPGRYEPIDW